MEKQIYSYDEAYQASLEYFKGDELAARVWVNKYAVKDSYGNIYEKSPEDIPTHLVRKNSSNFLIISNTSSHKEAL